MATSVGIANEKSTNFIHHWSVSCSVLVTAITLGRDFTREIEKVQNSRILWYLVESLCFALLIFVLSKKLRCSDILVSDKTASSVINYFSDEGGDQEIPKTATMETQTENKDYMEMSEKLNNHYKVKFSKINKEIREIRKTCSSKLSKFKKATKVVTKKMSEIQLKLPMLTQENKFLKEERNKLYPKIEEEAERKKDLEEKLSRLHTYLKCQGKAALAEPVRELVQA